MAVERHRAAIPAICFMEPEIVSERRKSLHEASLRALGHAIHI
jgi:hypothetical protein